ncbi:MAG: sigma 54-interacting transcriptional regulator [Betaproteobacteria bacterium]|nr:sigma 54-interacting transcriptional regulator [Betaproteobacteria bacterium]
MNTTAQSKGAILVVDDDAPLLRIISLRLREEGYAVVTAGSGEQALAHIAMKLPHLVLTDLQMGGMDGLDLFDAIHRDYPSLPVIILTAHGTIPDAVTATKRGVFGFLTKPFEARTLLTEVERALRVSTPQTAALPTAPDSAWRKDIVTRSPAMEEVLQQAQMVSATDASVFIHGESGTGKELLARAIHRASRRGEREFVAVNCGAIPEPLLESELFGYVKGAFTGAVRDHKGLFQAAHGVTLFLDEIGDMPVALQVKLLRVLQERQVRPVGAVASTPIDVRVVSASHRNLQDEMSAGRFREDLYYRLNVVSLSLPTLAQRREDIPLLAGHFLRQLAERYGKNVTALAPDAIELMLSAPWPGNVRQLYNVVEQTVALSVTPLVPASLVQRALQQASVNLSSLDEAKRRFERDYLVQLLKMTRGNVSQAARLAKRNRSDFYSLLARHSLDPGQFKSSVE